MGPTKRTFPCEVCSKVFTAKSSHAAHMVSHGAPKVSCSQCGKTFSDKVNLNRHKRNEHSGAKFVHRCRGCGYTATRSDNVRRHTLKCDKGRILGIERVASTAANNTAASGATGHQPPQTPQPPQPQQHQQQQQQQDVQEQMQEQQQSSAYQHADSWSPESSFWSAPTSISSLSDLEFAQLLTNSDTESANGLLDYAKNVVTSSSSMSLSQEQKLLCLEQLESVMGTAPDGSKYAALKNLMDRLEMPAQDVSLETVTDTGAQFFQTLEQLEQQPVASGLELGLEYQMSLEQLEHQPQPMHFPLSTQTQPWDEMGFVDFLNMAPDQMIV